MSHFRRMLTFFFVLMTSAHGIGGWKIADAVAGESKTAPPAGGTERLPKAILEGRGITPENAVKVRISWDYTFAKPLAVKILVRALTEVSEPLDNPAQHGKHPRTEFSFEVEGPGEGRVTIPFALRGPEAGAPGRICCVAGGYKPVEPIAALTAKAWHAKFSSGDDLEFEEFQKKALTSLSGKELREEIRVSDRWKQTSFLPDELVAGVPWPLPLADKLEAWMEIIGFYQPKGLERIKNRDLLAWAYNETLSALVGLQRWNEFEATLGDYERLFGSDSRPSRLWTSLSYAQDAQLKAMWHRIVALDKQGRRKEALEMKLRSHESWMRLFEQHRAKLSPGDLFRDYAGFYWTTPLEIARRYKDLGQYDEALTWYRKVQAHWADEAAFRDFKGQRSEEMEKGEKDLRDDLENRIRKFNRDELPKLIAECEQKLKDGRKP